MAAAGNAELEEIREAVAGSPFLTAALDEALSVRRARSIVIEVLLERIVVAAEHLAQLKAALETITELPA